MDYLCLFDVWKGPTDNEEVDFTVQFKTEARQGFWHEDSLYMSYEVFTLFVGCFERSVDEINHFGQTTFRVPNLIRLQDELRRCQKACSEAKDIGAFRFALRRSAAKYGGLQYLDRWDPNWELDWESLAGAVDRVFGKLLSLVTEHVNKKERIEVLGP